MNDKRFESWWASNPARAALGTAAKEVARGIWRAAQRDIATKPADDGWVEWNGGNRPVAAHCEVEIVCREGSANVACAYHFDWTHTQGTTATL